MKLESVRRRDVGRFALGIRPVSRCDSTVTEVHQGTRLGAVKQSMLRHDPILRETSLEE